MCDFSRTHCLLTTSVNYNCSCKFSILRFLAISISTFYCYSLRYDICAWIPGYHECNDGGQFSQHSNQWTHDDSIGFIEMIALIFIFIYFSLFSFQMYIPINNYKFVESSIELNLNQFWMCVCVKHKSSASWWWLNNSARHNKRHRVQHTLACLLFAINCRGISLSLDPDPLKICPW